MLDIKSKSNQQNKVLGLFLGGIIIAVLSIVIVELYTPIYKNSQIIMQNHESQKLSNDLAYEKSLKGVFINTIYKSNFVLSLDVIQKNNFNNLDPSDVFLTKNWKLQPLEENSTKNETDNSSYDEDTNSKNEEFEYYFHQFALHFNDLVLNWKQEFNLETTKTYPSFLFYTLDTNTGTEITNTLKALPTLLNNTAEAKELKNSFPFYLVIKTGKDGSVTITDSKGLNESNIEELLLMTLNHDILQDVSESMWSQGDFTNFYQKNNLLSMPGDITIIYASEAEDFYNTGNIRYDSFLNKYSLFLKAGLGYLFLAACIVIIIFAFLLPFIKNLGIGTGISTRTPFEPIILAMMFTIPATESISGMAWEAVNSGFIFDNDFTVLSKPIQNILTYGFHVVIWMLVLSIWYLGALSIRQVFSLGLFGYLKEKTVTLRFLRWIHCKLKKAFIFYEKIDLSERSNKIIMKCLILNFIILAIISCFWLFGIVLLIPYSVILFIMLRKRMDDIKNKYSILLDGTKQIANGNLELTFHESIGVFEPLKKELEKIQEGFLKAVEEETKSERMKTELITNVSHDLKTPLTAIITYVDLLKSDSITEEERKSYIDTLDMKSQRLKRLIEDLFEVSKASSNNITLNLVEVDLVHLIKQVLLELDDKIKESSIDFRLNLPKDKVVLSLDSEKTYRIFENLIINITKYAMPQTRAYIDMNLMENTVIIDVKNISATELNFNTEELTERFVRGDLSRNTEGSGLGLAITKSFVEVQGGRFTIDSDGDLFKASIEWKRM